MAIPIPVCEPKSIVTVAAFETAQRAELVRGHDQSLLQRVGPLVLESCVTLDLATVDRIDAAGITALLALYQTAERSGHSFRVANCSSHVAEILTMVGLDRFLLSHNAVRADRYSDHQRRPAA